MSAIAYAFVALSAVTTMSCGERNVRTDINRPIAQARVAERVSLERTLAVVRSFAREHNFALQEPKTPKGMLEFHVRLFRDDISLVISKLTDGPVEVMAYPLCACEADRRLGIAAVAESEVNNLQNRISQGQS